MPPHDGDGASAPAGSHIRTPNDRASSLVREALALLARGEPGAALQAVALLDCALDLRLRLPTHASPLLQYDLAGTWLNRADALVGLEDTERTAEALQSYDTAVSLLQRLPLEADARFPRRLAIAHQNRGLARRRYGSAEPAIADFFQAIAVLEREECSTLPDRPYLLAAVWVSVADVQAGERTRDAWRRAIDSAAHARRLIGGAEQHDLGAAEVGLKARHVCCRAIARCLAEAAFTTTPDDDVHAATDAAEEGLDLVRLWERRGVTRFRPVAEDLFRFGAGVYERFQPHFTREFVSDHRDAWDR